ncbi:hypothetical protein [uncultured Cohaesibacter sp.]
MDATPAILIFTPILLPICTRHVSEWIQSTSA